MRPVERVELIPFSGQRVREVPAHLIGLGDYRLIDCYLSPPYMGRLCAQLLFSAVAQLLKSLNRISIHMFSHRITKYNSALFRFGDEDDG